MALEIREPDMSCYPFRRKGLYLAIVIPYLAVLTAVFFFLLLAGRSRGRRFAGWRTAARGVRGLVFLSMYLGMCHFQAYCCACQECPYIGGFCPAIAGIYPANVLARLTYPGGKVEKSEERLRRDATLAGACWGGMIAYPVPWLLRRSRAVAAAYLLAHLVYYVFHGLTLCPVCAIRETCPGGTLQKIVLRTDD